MSKFVGKSLKSKLVFKCSLLKSMSIVDFASCFKNAVWEELNMCVCEGMSLWCSVRSQGWGC